MMVKAKNVYMKKIIDLKSYLTFLSRNKVYTAINVFGLSVSLMFVILIGVYVQQEYSVDSGITKADRTVVMGIEWPEAGQRAIGSHWRVQKLLRKRYPEIETSCAIHINQQGMKMPNEELVQKDVLYADSTFFRVFDYQLIKGDPEHALDSRDNVVVDEQFARLYFGDADPMGKTIPSLNGTPLKVTGIVRQMEGVHLHRFDLIERYELTEIFNPYLYAEHMGNATGADIYLVLKPTASVGDFIATKEKDMTDYFKTFFWMFQQEGSDAEVRLIPLSDLYFSKFESSNGHSDRGDQKLVNLLFTVGLVILLFAMINYINLTTAQSTYRSKEMAVRRLLGSQRADIMLRLIMESIVLCVLSLAIAILLAYYAAPVANVLLKTELHLSHLLEVKDVLLMAGLTLVVGVLAGVLPAVVMSRAKPIDIVRGTFRRQTKMLFSKVFIILQNVITIVMIACALVMVLQTDHLITAPLGFETENIMEIDNAVGSDEGGADSEAVDAFVKELMKIPGVKLVSKTAGTPAGYMNNSTFEMNHRQVSSWILEGDENYMKMFGLEVEREYPGADGSYVTRSYLEDCGLPDTVRSIYFPKGEYRRQIRGIIKPIHLRSITDGRSNVELVIHDRGESFLPWQYAVKYEGDADEVFSRIKALYKERFHIDYNPDLPLVEQKIAKYYEKEVQLSAIITLFAVIAILISLLGLIAMSTYFIQQRQKEIAVRKVFGSTSRQIWTSLVRTFLIYVVVAFVIAVPIVWYFMSDWLSGYSYRISLSWWIFALAGLFCLMVSFVAVFIQSYLASNANPINHIKDNG